MKMDKVLKKILPSSFLQLFSRIKVGLLDGYSVKSYSQEGEDIILKEIFSEQEKGLYVNIGVHHPKRFSNTFYFYQKGWRGINIDPAPGTKFLFDKACPHDINLEIGISTQLGELTLYIFNDAALNTFDEKRALELTETTSYKLIGTKKVKVCSLKNVLEEYAFNAKIDFMTIDVEGYELEVSKSNDWSKHRPKILLIEILKLELDKINENPLHVYLMDKGYKVFAKTLRTVFYRDTYWDLSSDCFKRL